MSEDLCTTLVFWAVCALMTGSLLGLAILFSRAVRPLTRREPRPGIIHADAEVQS